ncbi:MAG: DUF433 domain-containing protein [Acetobacteraceae bacterium]
MTFQSGKMGGRACVRGLRITAGILVALVAEGTSVPEILQEYAELEA